MSNKVYALIHDADEFEFTLHNSKHGAVSFALEYMINNIHKTGDDEDKVMNIIEFGTFEDHLKLLKQWKDYVGDTEFFRIEEKTVFP